MTGCEVVSSSPVPCMWAKDRMFEGQYDHPLPTAPYRKRGHGLMNFERTVRWSTSHRLHLKIVFLPVWLKSSVQPFLEIAKNGKAWRFKSKSRKEMRGSKPLPSEWGLGKIRVLQSWNQEKQTTLKTSKTNHRVRAARKAAGKSDNQERRLLKIWGMQSELPGNGL